MESKLDSIGGNIAIWLRFTVVWMVLCGLVYPTLTTLLAGAIFPKQAQGSLIEQSGKIIGSELIGQPFSGERYFSGRPSAAGIGYDPRSASGTNWAVSNPALRERVQKDAQVIAKREGISVEQIPPDLLAASGSGLDPHISPQAAQIQIARVARARGLSERQVRQLVEQNTQQGILGHPRVNVLKLNLALDALR